MKIKGIKKQDGKNMTIYKQAQLHSIFNGYAWVLTNGINTFYTDSDVLTQRYTDRGYTIIAEFIDGYRTH